MNPDYLEYDSLANTGYNELANVDLSCIGVAGCTNPIASNFNENANFDDGSNLMQPGMIKVILILLQ